LEVSVPLGFLELGEKLTLWGSGQHPGQAVREPFPFANVLTPFLPFPQILSTGYEKLVRGGNTSLTGKAKAVTADLVKEGAVVIDVGVNRVGVGKEGKAILYGAVVFEALKEKAGRATPVPGGVDP